MLYEVITVQAHPGLAVEDRPGAFEPDQDRGEHHDRPGHQDQHHRVHDRRDVQLRSAPPARGRDGRTRRRITSYNVCYTKLLRTGSQYTDL